MTVRNQETELTVNMAQNSGIWDQNGYFGEVFLLVILIQY
jgi:hypothetical protein